MNVHSLDARLGFFNLLRFRHKKDFIFTFLHIIEDILRRDLRINIIVLRSDWLL